MDLFDSSKVNLKRQKFDTKTLRFKFPYIEGHRGCKYEPENSMSAFKKAIEMGCDSIELDIWLTKDKEIIVIHGTPEGEISGTTTGKGIINNLLYEEIASFEIGNNQKIPLLREVFEFCKEKIFINIEIKDKQVANMIDVLIPMIEYYNIKNQIAISSFNHEYHNELRRRGLDQEYEFGFLYNHDGEDENYDWTKPGTINMYSNCVNEEKVKLAHDHGKAVVVWFWKDGEETEEKFEKLINYGVDVICTNFPDIAINARKKVYSECLMDLKNVHSNNVN